MALYIEDVDLTTIEEVSKEETQQERQHRFNEESVLQTPHTLYQKSYRRLNIEPSETDDAYLVRAGDVGRLDNIAWRWYRNLNLWWVIAEVNNIKDPFDFEAGKYIRIPKLSRIFLEVI